MYKYILFIIIGILFFLYINNLNKFTIGIPALYTKRNDMGARSCNIYYTPGDTPLHALDFIDLQGVPSLNVIRNEILINPLNFCAIIFFH